MPQLTAVPVNSARPSWAAPARAPASSARTPPTPRQAPSRGIRPVRRQVRPARGGPASGKRAIDPAERLRLAAKPRGVARWFRVGPPNAAEHVEDERRSVAARRRLRPAEGETLYATDSPMRKIDRRTCLRAWPSTRAWRGDETPAGSNVKLRKDTTRAAPRATEQPRNKCTSAVPGPRLLSTSRRRRRTGACAGHRRRARDRLRAKMAFDACSRLCRRPRPERLRENPW